MKYQSSWLQRQGLHSVEEEEEEEDDRPSNPFRWQSQKNRLPTLKHCLKRECRTINETLSKHYRISERGINILT